MTGAKPIIEIVVKDSNDRKIKKDRKNAKVNHVSVCFPVR